MLLDGYSPKRGMGLKLTMDLSYTPYQGLNTSHLGAFRVYLMNCQHNIVPDKLGCIPMKGIRSPPTWSFSKVPYSNVGGGILI
jgi:hypothetical protein